MLTAMTLAYALENRQTAKLANRKGKTEIFKNIQVVFLGGRRIHDGMYDIPTKGLNRNFTSRTNGTSSTDQFLFATSLA